jgi:hypothetical protein
MMREADDKRPTTGKNSLRDLLASRLFIQPQDNGK